MFYPTVTCRKKIHAVKDERTCECGITYRNEIPNKQKDLFKPIHFMHLNRIDCKDCKEILKHITK